MSMVRFATLCDKCGKRSEEYTAWPTCKDCGDDVCTECDIDSERTEDERNATLCPDCRMARSQEDPGMPHASDCRYWVKEPCDCLTGKDPRAAA
jgi:hypothetical protein